MCADFPCSNREASVHMPPLLLWQPFSHSLSAGLKREILVISPTTPQCPALSHFKGSCSVSRLVSACAGHTSAKPVRQVKHEIRCQCVLAPPRSHTQHELKVTARTLTMFFYVSLSFHTFCAVAPSSTYYTDLSKQHSFLSTKKADTLLFFPPLPFSKRSPPKPM